MNNHRPTRRPYHSSAQRRKFIELFHAGHLTRSEFARKHGLKPGTFQQWLYRLNHRSNAGRAVFQEVHLPAPLLAAAPTVEISVGAEITLRLSSPASPEFIAKVVHHLRRPC